MRADLDKQLCTEFARLYKDRHQSMMDTAMCWGFSCGDGWFQIIYDLSQAIEKIADEAGVGVPIAVQVKEKFGTLSFYLSDVDQKISKQIWQLIVSANGKSSTVCEICGKPGRLRRRAYLQTLCDAHA